LKAFFTSKCHVVSWYTHKYNSIYACNIHLWEKAGLPCTIFHTIWKISIALCADLLYGTSLEPDNKLCCFSQNSQSLITFFWTFYLLNFIPHMCKISFVPSSRYCFYCTNFHETHNCSMTLCIHLLYWISPKPVTTTEHAVGNTFMPLVWTSVSWFSQNRPLPDNFCKERLYRI